MMVNRLALILIQVILDLGHVTFGNVTDWSCESVSVGMEPGLDDDDDGK